MEEADRAIKSFLFPNMYRAPSVVRIRQQPNLKVLVNAWPQVLLFLTVVVIAFVFIKVFRTDLGQVRGDA